MKIAKNLIFDHYSALKNGHRDHFWSNLTKIGHFWHSILPPYTQIMFSFSLIYYRTHRYGHFKPLTRFVNSFWRSQWLFTFNFRQFNSKIYKIWPQKVFWKITNNFFLKPPVHVGIWNFNIIYLYWVPWLFSRRNFEFSLFSLFFVVFVIAPHRKSLKWRFLSAKKKKSKFRREKSRGTL